MKKYIAEFVGTLVLVLVACGVASITGGNLVATSLACGLVIVAMAYSIGNVSGCHINPAVSLGMLITGKMNLKEFGYYVLAQVLGATAGAAILGLLLDSFTNLGANGFGSNLATNAWIAILIEVILTFIFIKCV